MRVMFTNDAPLIKYGIADGFRQAGHEVCICTGENRLWGKSSNEQLNIVTKVIEEFSPDLVFSEGFAGIDVHKIYLEIKNRKIPFFYWAIEDPVTLHIAEAHLPYADCVFTTTIERIPYYRDRGLASDVLLFACNPEMHRNMGKHEQYEHDIVLVGTNYSNRYKETEWFVMPLVEAGYDIKIWGLWWDDDKRPVNLCEHPEVYGGVLPYEELANVYSSAKIVLGMNCDATSITQTSMRPYEVLGCGVGTYVGHYTKAVENIFGDMLIQVRNTSRLFEVVDHILYDQTDEMRKRLVDWGQEYVYSMHTYKHRAEQVVDKYNELFG